MFGKKKFTEVFIKAKELPESCIQCPFTGGMGDAPNYVCFLTGNQLTKVCKRCDKDCPLRIKELYD